MKNITKVQAVPVARTIPKPENILRDKIREEIKLENEKNIADPKRLLR